MKEQTQETRNVGTITISRAEYEELKSQNEWLMEQLRLLKKQFGTSSEQAKEQLDGQLSLLFNETEAYLQAGRNQTEAQRSGFSLGRRARERDEECP